MKEMQRMPAESSICWNSGDSRRSISSSSGSGVDYRHYVDPWDLENYAYLRRHSVADVPQQTQRPPTYECSLRDARACSEYWYTSSSSRKSEYDGSPYGQELYRRQVTPINNSFYYQQAIYEDEKMDYATSFPIYASVLGISRSPQEKSSSPAIHADEDRYIVQAIPPPHIHLNTYGHLKIDYTNSWNSLNRRIRK